MVGGRLSEVMPMRLETVCFNRPADSVRPLGPRSVLRASGDIELVSCQHPTTCFKTLSQPLVLFRRTLARTTSPRLSTLTAS